MTMTDPTPGTPRQSSPLAVRSYEEVAAILGCHWTAVQQGEKRALKQLREHPLMRRLFEETNQ